MSKSASRSQLAVGKGFLLSGTQATDKGRYRKWLLVAAAGNVTALVTVQVPDQDTTYPDKTMRDALATLAVRDNVPDAEQLSLLPFTVGDLAGFHIDDVLPGRALMLVDKPSDAAPAQAKDQSQSKDAKDQRTDAPILNARLFIAAMPGGPAEAKRSRAISPAMTFDQIVGIKDVQIQDAEPLRIGNQPGFETLAKAKDAQSDTDVMVVQWLRFGTGGLLANDRHRARRHVADHVDAAAHRARQHRSEVNFERYEFAGGSWRCRCWRSRRHFRAALRHPDQSRPQHPLADHVAGLHHLHDAAGRHRRVGHFEHGLMQIGIEFLALRRELADAVFLQRLEKFALGQIRRRRSAP